MSFCRGVWEQLFRRVDCKAAEHDHRFRAHDSDWNQLWSLCVSFRPADYFERYSELEDYPISVIEIRSSTVI